MKFGLDYLLGPRPADEFLSEQWGRTALLVPGAPDKFEGLFGWPDINHLLSHVPLAYPTTRLVLEKERLPPEALAQMGEWLRKGATLVIDHVQNVDPVVDRFTSALARDLNSPVNANCYASWPGKQGFDIHFDRHDVFVVQVSGRKAWRVFEPTHVWPVEQDSTPKRPAPPEGHQPYLTCTLKPGDVLYVPRGHWHDAVAETSSVHLTLGFSPRTGVDLLSWLAGHLMATDALVRQSFPLPGSRALGGSRPEDELLEHWAAVRRRLVEALERDDLLDGFLQFCMLQNPARRTYQLPDHVVLAESLTMDTGFVVAAEQKAIVRYDEASRLAELLLRGQVLRLENVPARFADAILAPGAAVRGRDLLAAYPELEPGAVRRFLLQLFEVGILLLVEGPEH